MTSFKYRARTADGTAVNGFIEAYDEFEAVDQLRLSYPIVEKLEEIKEKKSLNIDLNEPLWVSDKVLSLTASQFSIMLKAGLPMARVVELIAGQTSDKLMKRILTACASDVAAGYSLARSLEKNGKKIPAVFIETVRAGEESGTLERSFDTLHTYYEKSHKTRSKVRSALTYPIIVIILAFVVVGIVMVVLVPTMISLFNSMGTELPLPTRILIAMSNFFSRFWPVILIVIGVLGAAYYAYGKTPEGQLRYSRIHMHLPVLGRIAVMNTAAQIANTMSTLLGSGLPINKTVEILSRVVDLRCVGADLERCVGKLETGQSLGDVLRDVADLPDMLVEMAQVGEQSGSLEETLGTIGEYYDSEATTASDRALAMLEPTITIILGVFVAFLVISIYVPMFSMYDGIGM